MLRLELGEIDIRRKADTGEDYDFATVTLFAQERGHKLTYSAEVLFEGSVDKAVSEATKKLEGLASKIFGKEG